MPRIIKKPGDILKFPLSTVGQHAYAQWLSDGTACFFLAATTAELTVSEVMVLPFAFRVIVYNDTPNRYGWSKIGKAAIPDEFSYPQHYAKRDSISGKLSIYFEEVETPATAAQLRGLETLAVWSHLHIVERLEAQLEGRESKFLKSVSVLA